MPINGELDNKEIYNVQLDKSGEFLYASTNGGSVYRSYIKPAIPLVDITKPVSGLYFNDNKIMSLSRSIIFGDITIIPHINSGMMEFDRVEIYIDDTLKKCMYDEPYEWEWNETVFGQHTIKVMAFDYLENIYSAEINIWIFNP